MVAIDANGRPVPIPQFEPTTAEEKKEWELVASIRQHLLKHRHSKND
jgi:acyl-CoA hydrolase